MFKKHMTPLKPHSTSGSLHSSPNKGSSQRTLPGAANGGMPSSFQSYGKATPMADAPDDGSDQADVSGDVGGGF